MDARQHSATVDQLVKNCDKLIDGGYHCAVVYSTPNGILLTTGTPVRINKHIVWFINQQFICQIPIYILPSKLSHHEYEFFIFLYSYKYV